jgi:TolB-like protein
VATQSARSFKDSPLDIRQIAERLGARYVLGGSVRLSAAMARVSGHLIDATTGLHLWSETYDRKLTDVDMDAVQDEVTDRIASTVADQSGVLVRSMIQSIRGVPLRRATPRQLVLRCWGWDARPSASEHAELRAALGTYLLSQPDAPEIWAELAQLYIAEHGIGFNPLPDPLDRALRAARRAIEIDPGHQCGWLSLAIACFHLRDEAGLTAAAERAIGVNPRNSHVLAWLGNMLTCTGEHDRGCQLTERAIALNAAHPGWYHLGPFNRSFARHDFAGALHHARRINTPDLIWMHVAIAAAAGHLGLIREAAAAAHALAVLAPALAGDDTLREYLERWYWDPDDVELVPEGMRRARAEPSLDTAAPPTAADAPARQPARRSRSGSATATSGARVRIAVLPFADLSPAGDQGWLCDGIAEEILNTLARVDGIEVVARTSAFSFKGKNDDVAEIARVLGVAHVLEGSVRRAGDRVRVSVQLIAARDSRQVWSERYDRAMTDVLAMQDDIAEAVTAALSGTLHLARPDRRHTPPPAAYELFLKGRAQLIRFTPDAWKRARTYFEEAIAIDPQYAAPHGELALGYFISGMHGMQVMREVAPFVRAEVQRALQLDPADPQPRFVLGAISLAHDYDWQGAAAQFAASMQGANVPSHARWIYASLFLRGFGRFDDSAGEMHRAVQQDPLNATWYAIWGAHLIDTGRLDQAIDATRQGVDLEPNYFVSQLLHGEALWAAGRQPEGVWLSS